MAVVYEHIRNDNNEVFYVGIGEEEGRAYVKYGRNPHWKNIVNKVGYTVNIVYKDIEHKEAKKIEILLIEKYGRKNLGLGNLVNMTDGGEGVLGVVVSEETRQKLSEALKGRKLSEEHIQKLSEALKGRKLSEEHIQKMRDRVLSEETKQKMSEALKGRTFSEETKQKLSEAQKGENNGFFGKKHSEETRHKYRNRTYSEETRKKMSEAKKGKTRSESFKKKNRENKRNQEGVKGYHFKEKTNKYYSSIHVMNKTIYLGAFDTPEEASEAYQKARLIYFV